jgi:hypothetical protein
MVRPAERRRKALINAPVRDPTPCGGAVKAVQGAASSMLMRPGMFDAGRGPTDGVCDRHVQMNDRVEPDRDNLRHDGAPLWSVAVPPWHTDAVGGGGHIINASNPMERAVQQDLKRRTANLGVCRATTPCCGPAAQSFSR